MDEYIRNLHDVWFRARATVFGLFGSVGENSKTDIIRDMLESAFRDGYVLGVKTVTGRNRVHNG